MRGIASRNKGQSSIKVYRKDRSRYTNAYSKKSSSSLLSLLYNAFKYGLIVIIVILLCVIIHLIYTILYDTSPTIPTTPNMPTSTTASTTTTTTSTSTTNTPPSSSTSTTPTTINSLVPLLKQYETLNTNNDKTIRQHSPYYNDEYKRKRYQNLYNTIYHEKYVKVIPSNKVYIKQDMKIILDEIEGQLDYSSINRPIYNIGPTNIEGRPRALVVAEETLKRHPMYSYLANTKEPTLHELMAYLQQSSYCVRKPIFLSMATVGDELYWQLIENFVYTMVKFNTSECSVVICVSDSNCMNKCKDSFFPCYDYQYAIRPLPSVMEQIAEVKLYHVPKALSLGVDVFMLDLDVGFLGDPMHMVRAFHETPLIDIFVQEDLIFIMNRTKAGWKTWFTEPLPNIGLFLCRGNNKTAKVFDIAWKKYVNMPDKKGKVNPGKDQAHVLEGMRIGRGTFGLRYAYFDNDTAVLMDKMCKFVSRTVELGGEAAATILADQKTLAMHTTCYEHVTKVMGLKAANAFWNPKYYDPIRPTITKQIMYVSELQLLDEVRSLMWLALETKRSLITPNILGADDIETVDKYYNQALWPGFRVSHLKRLGGKNALRIDIIEPAYYWRVNRDYDDVPEPTILSFDPNAENLSTLKKRILALGTSAPRLVLYAKPKSVIENDVDANTRVTKWAKDSVGIYDLPYSQEIKRYGSISSVKDIRSENGADDVLQGVRNCMNIFGPLKGNRTCFQICD